MADFAVTITYLDTDNAYKTIVLETVNDVTVSTTSELTTHPIVNGDLVADHMIKQPCTMGISGTLSLHGSQVLTFVGEGSKLANAQSVFENIKNNALLCEIVKISNISNEIRFLQRSNMALTSIQWTESINSLQYTFSFTQVMLASVKEYEVSTDDMFLPNITEPSTLNFTDSLIDWEQVDTSLIQILRTNKLLEEDFLVSLQSLTSAQVSALIAAGLVTVALNAIPFIGHIATIVIAIVAAAIVFVTALVNWITGLINRSKYRIKVFKAYENDKKQQKEVARFCNFTGSIHIQLQQLNNVLHVYQIASNEEQECMISIANNYYIFTFTKNNTTGKYKCVVTDINEKERAVINDLSSALESIDQCTTQNSIMRADESGAYVYLMYAASNEDANRNDLTNYMIFVSEVNMEEYDKLIEDIIEEALLA